MKELSIEEKAKAYDKAIEKAKYYYDEGKTLEYANDIVSDIFPELKESEDERIRKTICKLLWDNVPYEEAQKYIAWLEKQGVQKPQRMISAEAKEAIYDKPTWSEEDEKIALSIEQIFNCASLLNIVPDKIEKVKSWLKNLKDRVQPKQEWSEEDTNLLDNCISLIEDIPCTDNEQNWLKSLKDRHTWKPSDEQMDVLLSEVTAWTKGCSKQKVLESLYNDLKKLRKE